MVNLALSLMRWRMVVRTKNPKSLVLHGMNVIHGLSFRSCVYLGQYMTGTLPKYTFTSRATALSPGYTSIFLEAIRKNGSSWSEVVIYPLLMTTCSGDILSTTLPLI